MGHQWTLRIALGKAVFIANQTERHETWRILSIFVIINHKSCEDKALVLHEHLQANGYTAFCTQKWEDENLGTNIRLATLNAIASSKVIIVLWDGKCQKDRNLCKKFLETARKRITESRTNVVLVLNVVFDSFKL